MTYQDKKIPGKKRTPFAVNEPSEELSSEAVYAAATDKRHRKVSPVGFRVLIRLQKENNISEGGLYLPEGAKQNLDESVLGQVIEVASATDENSDQDANISGIPLGATVLISKHVGIKLPWDPELRLVETKDVLAIVEEVTLD